MAKKVELLINGSPYSVWCKEDDEDKIVRLGAELEARTSKIAKNLRPESEAHALFLTSLVLLSEVEEKSRQVKDEAGKMAQETQEKTAQEESFKKEIDTFKSAFELAKNQVGLLADRAEKVLAEVKETLQESA